jgi:hypothetical protein
VACHGGAASERPVFVASVLKLQRNAAKLRSRRGGGARASRLRVRAPQRSPRRPPRPGGQTRRSPTAPPWLATGEPPASGRCSSRACSNCSETRQSSARAAEGAPGFHGCAFAPRSGGCGESARPMASDRALRADPVESPPTPAATWLPLRTVEARLDRFRGVSGKTISKQIAPHLWITGLIWLILLRRRSPSAPRAAAAAPPPHTHRSPRADSEEKPL